MVRGDGFIILILVLVRVVLWILIFLFLFYFSGFFCVSERLSVPIEILPANKFNPSLELENLN